MTSDQSNKYLLRATIARNTSLFTLIAMAIMLIVTTFNGSVPEGVSPITVLMIKLVPLGLLVPGLIKHKTRTHVWLCFVILLYFTSYTLHMMQSDWAILPSIMSTMTVVIFICSMLYVNWTGKSRKLQANAEG